MAVKNKIVVTQPCTLKIKGLYENAIRNTNIFLSLLYWAEDETIKQPWKRAGLLTETRFANELDEKIKITNEGEIWSFTTDEVIKLYYCMDICCRYYISEIGEQKRDKMIESGRSTGEKLEKEKTFTIGSTENIVRELKDAMKKNAKFKQAISILNTLEIVPFNTPLLEDIFKK